MAVADTLKMVPRLKVDPAKLSLSLYLCPSLS